MADMNAALLAFLLIPYHSPVVCNGVTHACFYDYGAPMATGKGYCKDIDSHWHEEDDECHRDSDDSVLKILPKVNNETI